MDLEGQGFVGPIESFPYQARRAAAFAEAPGGIGEREPSASLQ